MSLELPDPNPILIGLALLLEAHEFARDAGCDPWDFAVELPVLVQAGVSVTQLRWLISKGFVAHALDVTPRGDDVRLFRNPGKHNFRQRSCFILTPQGLDLARSHRGHPRPPFPDMPEAMPRSPDSTPPPPQPPPKAGDQQHNGSGPNSTGTAPSALLPEWDPKAGQLRVGSDLVRVFSRRVSYQRRILDVFQELKWRERIDDPLPASLACDSKLRLHDTIKRLNRYHQCERLRFTGDGCGCGVCWTLVFPKSLKFDPARWQSAQLPTGQRKQS